MKMIPKAGSPVPLATQTYRILLSIVAATSLLAIRNGVRADSLACVAPPAGLVSWWRAEGSGTDGYGLNHGTLGGGASYSPGIVGQAFSFDGVNGYVSVPDSPSLRPSSLAIEGWFNFNSLNTQVLVAKTAGTGTSESFVMFYSAGSLFAGVGNANTLGPLVSFSWAPTLGQWYHLGYTFDAASKSQALYLNGIVRNSGPAPTPIGYDTHPVTLGAEFENESLAYFFYGEIDEVSLYARALPAAEIQAIYQAQGFGKCLLPCLPSPGGCISWWPAEGSGTDSYGLNSGSLIGGLGFTSGVVGQAFNFTADGQEVSIPASASLDVGAGANGFSIEGWVNPADTTLEYPMVEWQGGTHFWVNVSFSTFGGPGSLYASLSQGTTNGIISTGPGVMTAGVWQHVAFTYNKTTQVGRLYRNGVELASRNVGAAAVVTGGVLHLGFRPGYRSHRGQLDEFAVYNRPLSLAEIQAIYRAAQAGKCPVGQFAEKIFAEDFESGFSSATGWIIGNDDPSSGGVRWRAVNQAFGGEGTHGGAWKAYCAGSAYPANSSEPNPQYLDFMNAYARRTLDLTAYSAATLEFWHKMPSLGAGDFGRVLAARPFQGDTELWRVNSVVPGWTRATVNLNSYVGVNSDIVIRFRADSLGHAEGWYIDDFLVTGVRAAGGDTLEELSSRQNTGFVLDSDALSSDPAYDRESIRADAIVRSFNGTLNSSNYSYVLSFTLLDDTSGQPFPIYNVTGQTNASYSYDLTNTVTVPAQRDIRVRSTAFLRPAVRLNPVQTYTVKVALVRDGATLTNLMDVSRRYLHFTNTVSGDPSLNVIAVLTNVAYPQSWLLSSVPGKNGFMAEAQCVIARYDDWLLPGRSTQATVTVTYEMRDETNGLVPLASNVVSQTLLLSNAISGPVTCPAVVVLPITVPIVPLIPNDSVNHSNQVIARLSHIEYPGGPVVIDNSVSGPLQRFLYFTGRLFFGPRLLNITDFGLAPTPGSIVAGPTLNVTLRQVTLTSPSVAELAFTRGTLAGVRLATNGDATYNGLPFTVPFANFPVGNVSNICFVRTNFSFRSTGIQAIDVTVRVPTGFGFNLGDEAKPSGRVLQSTFALNNVGLDDYLRPTNTSFTWSAGAPSRYYFSEETKPIWIPADAISWFPQEGRFELTPVVTANVHVRHPEYYALDHASPVQDPESLNKKSNDRYYDTVNGISTLNVRAGSRKEALLSTTVSFSDAAILTHYPYSNLVLNASGTGGFMVISNDLVTGQLGMSDARLSYTRDCLNDSCPPGSNLPDSFAFYPTTSGVLTFTPDGGLVGDVKVTAANGLEWGSVARDVFVHATLPAFNSAAYHMPGTFLRGDLTTLSADDRPGFMLLSGFGKPGDTNYVERPRTPDYETNGLANYAGLNFRVGSLGTTAKSTIAGTNIGPYPLTPRSKYYARYGGVSGIHEPVPGTVPANLTFYGYQFTFSSFGAAYWDNKMLKNLSIINGSVAVPYPSGFTQDFSHMLLTCRGDLDSADLPGNAPSHLLKYWGNRITPLAMDFYGPTNAPCDTNAPRKLGLLVETTVPFVPQPMHGVLGFNPNGNLVPPAANYPGLDSRLSVPANLTVRGPGSESYNFTTVGNAYLNNFDGAPNVAPNVGGWLNIAGKIDMPFFEDARVHLHVSAATSNSPIHLMGGWRASDDSRGHRAWTSGGLHYFNTLTNPALFDVNNWGYPKDNNVTLATYRTNTVDDLYHPRAQQTWQSFVDFDYPLDWSSVTRAFKSFRGQTNRLLVLEVGSQVKRMTPRNAEVTFGAEYGGLPKINVGGFLVDAVDDALGVSATLKKAFEQQGSLANKLEVGLTTLSSALNDRFDGFVRQALDGSVITPAVNALALQFYGSPASALPSGAFPLVQAGSDCLSDRSNCVQQILNPLIDDGFNHLSDAGGPVLGIVTDAVQKADDVLAVILFMAGTPGNRSIAQKIVYLLVKDQAAQFLGYLADTSFLNDTIEKSVGPTLDQIASRGRDLQKPLHKLRDEINGGFQQEVKDLVGGFAGRYAQALTQDIVDWLNQHPPPNLSTPHPLAPGKGAAKISSAAASQQADAFKAFLRQRMVDRFVASDVSAGIQVAVKQRLQDLDAEIREMLDSVFQQMNQAVRDALSAQLAELDNGIGSFLGNISDVMGGGQIQGYASINDDGLRKLRLDGKFRMSVPDPMQFRAYLEILQLNSEGSAGCKYDGTNTTEVKIGALGVPLDWITKGVNMDLHTKFTSDSKGARGFAGAIELRGKMKFEVLELSELAATIAFGLDEGYFGARARARLNAYEVAGGLWFGKSCDIMPLQIIDKAVAEVVPQPPPIIGGYAYAEGWVPVNEWIGVPSSCLLNIRAGIGAGIFFFESGQPRVRTYGGKVLLGADAEVLCIAHAQLILRLLGAKVGGDLKLRGQGDVEIEIGSCPFCIGLSKTVRMSLDNGDWSLDF